MSWRVLIAHAEDEEELAEALAEPLRHAGYEVAHRGTVLVGESVIEEASKVLQSGGPIVLCGTIRAMGTGWAQYLVNAAHHYNGVRVFPVQMEKKAYLQAVAFDVAAARYWEDPAKALKDLLASLNKYYPLEPDQQILPVVNDAELRYRDLALKSYDIIDIANLPEKDRYLATQRLLLRNLYVPLRLHVEIEAGREADDAKLALMEKQRDETRRQGATRHYLDGVYNRISIGQQLTQTRWLVVLGDPGAGKSTLLRWVATALLLKLQGSPDLTSLPDVSTLPDRNYLPILVRCRELDASCVRGSLEYILRRTLEKLEMTSDEVAQLSPLLLNMLRNDEALLLIDGLDEITDPMARAQFCKQIEQIHVSYPDACIIATSRIVGYREMGRRFGHKFQHSTVLDLSRTEKDEFARRWCELTEPDQRQEELTRELISAIHSTNRIEHLTGNPMLLTTLALVKRSLGKLPSRRADLYWEAVQVLLNWRQEVDAPLDHYEAMPQLEYMAYAMCDQGVQQLREDEVLELLTSMRKEYPQLYAVNSHSPQDFLHLLERRTGMIIEAGHVRHMGIPVPVFEFRHLTFQEYLAARALVEGHFYNRDRSKSLAANVARLAGSMVEIPTLFSASENENEVAVSENWREALRLCITSCNDDDVDSVLQAILIPLPEEDAVRVTRPRAILAALCLADEPHATESVARDVLLQFVRQCKFDNEEFTTMGEAVAQLAFSRWEGLFTSVLVGAFRVSTTVDQARLINLYSAGVRRIGSAVTRDFTSAWYYEKIRDLARDEETAIAAALELGRSVQRVLIFRGKLIHSKSRPIDSILDEFKELMLRRLVGLLTGSVSIAHAAASALHSFASAWERDAGELLRKGMTLLEIEVLLSTLQNPETDSIVLEQLLMAIDQMKYTETTELVMSLLRHENKMVRGKAIGTLGALGDARAVDLLIPLLSDEDKEVRHSAIWALGALGDARAVDPLISLLSDEDEYVRRNSVRVLSRLRGVRDLLDRKLLSLVFEDGAPYLDPREPITMGQIEAASKALNISVDEVRTRYKALASTFQLTLSWNANLEPLTPPPAY